MFKLTANTGYRCSCAWPHRGPLGVAPGWMPRADATELAPKKSAHQSPPAVPYRAAGGLSVFRPTKTKAYISLVKLPSGGPGLLNARPAAFAGRSNLLPTLRDTAGAYTSEYPIPPIHVTMHLGSGPTRQISPGTTVRRSKENNVTRYNHSARQRSGQRGPLANL